MLLRDNKNISPRHNILSNVQNKSFVLHEKQFYVEAKSWMLHKMSSGVDKNKLMLHKKWFYVKQKKVDVARKSVSCRQEQDDAAQKNYFELKKVLNFSGTARLRNTHTFHNKN